MAMTTQKLLELAKGVSEQTRAKVTRFRFRLEAARKLAGAASNLLYAGTEPDKQLAKEVLKLIGRLPEEPYPPKEKSNEPR